MTQDPVEYDPIGTIHSPFDAPEEMPIQPAGTDVEGTVEVVPAYTEGVQDLDGFTHCLLLYHFHATGEDASMTVEPFLDDEPRGLFATRAPRRPNPIGLSTVEIDAISENELTVTGVDVVDGTPLLDIKPFVPQFDVPAKEVETGWLDVSTSAIRSTRSDDRFV